MEDVKNETIEHDVRSISIKNELKPVVTKKY